MPEEDELPGSVHLRLVDAAGSEVFDLDTSHANGRRYTVGTPLAPGSYHLEASTLDGRRAAGSFELTLEDGRGRFEFVVPLR